MNSDDKGCALLLWGIWLTVAFGIGLIFGLMALLGYIIFTLVFMVGALVILE